MASWLLLWLEHITALVRHRQGCTTTWVYSSPSHVRPLKCVVCSSSSSNPVQPGRPYTIAPFPPPPHTHTVSCSTQSGHRPMLALTTTQHDIASQHSKNIVGPTPPPQHTRPHHIQHHAATRGKAGMLVGAAIASQISPCRI